MLIRSDGGEVTLVLKNLVFTLIVPGTVAGYVPYSLSENLVPASGLMRILAGALIVTGIAIYAWCLWDFAAFGRGTPAPIDAPRRLVVRGMYRYIRNPMYVGVLGIILGWAALYRSGGLAIYAACVAASCHLFIVLYEERHLARRFGAEYRDYCTNVNRWLPRLR